MYILSVIPIAKGFQPELLTYFSKEHVPLGYLVAVPLRKKIIPSIVLEITELRDAKDMVKGAGFTLRKIDHVIGPKLIDDTFLTAVYALATYSLTSPSAVLQALLPSILLSGTFTREETPILPHTEKGAYVFQDAEDTRNAYWKKLIRESFAKKESILIVVPTKNRAQELYDVLGKNIEDHTILFLSSMNVGASKKFVKQFSDTSHPLLIIGTPQVLALYRHDITTYLIEDSYAPTWRKQFTHTLDLRRFVGHLGSLRQARVIFADTLLPFDMQGNYTETTHLTPIAPLVYPDANTTVISMRRDTIEKTTRPNPILSKEVLEQIATAQEKKQSVFIFTLRKGLATSIICHDCETVLRCNICDKPVALREQRGTREAVCYHCKTSEEVPRLCSYCGSWHLVGLGIGVDRIREELTTHLPHIATYCIDKEHVQTERKAEECIRTWHEQGGVLIGTELALPYLKDYRPEHTIISSFDTLFALPLYTAIEKILHLVHTLSNLGKKPLIIQTRFPENPVLHFSRDTLKREIATELSDRKSLNYPPYHTHIRVYFTSDTEATFFIERLATLFYTSDCRKIVKNTTIFFVVSVSIPAKDFSLSFSGTPSFRPELLAILRTIPPYMHKEVNPEGLL